MKFEVMLVQSLMNTASLFKQGGFLATIFTFKVSPAAYIGDRRDWQAGKCSDNDKRWGNGDFRKNPNRID